MGTFTHCLADSISGQVRSIYEDGEGNVWVGTSRGLEASVNGGEIVREGRVLGTAHPWSLAAVTDVTLVAFPAPVIAALTARFPKVRKLLEAVQAAREREAAGKVAP